MKKIIPVLLYVFFFVWSGLLIVGLLIQTSKNEKKDVDMVEIEYANERADSIEAEIRSLPNTLNRLERFQKELEMREQAHQLLDEVTSKY